MRTGYDWRQPKNAKGWRTKVNYMVLNELDPVQQDSEAILIDGVERELRERLAQKALLQKSLTQLESKAPKAEGE